MTYVAFGPKGHIFSSVLEILLFGLFPPPERFGVGETAKILVQVVSDELQVYLPERVKK